MKLFLFALSIAISAVMPAAPAAQAGPSRPAPGPDKDHDRLELTSEQQVKFDGLRDAMKKKLIEHRAKMAAARVDLNSLRRADPPKRDAILSKQKEISGYRDMITTERTTFWFDVDAMLTPEQKKTWKKMLNDIHEDGGGRGLSKMFKKWKRYLGRGHSDHPERHDRQERQDRE